MSLTSEKNPLLSNQPMTNYHITPIIPLSIAAQEKKAARQKLLEAVRARRKIIYQQFQKKRQLQVDSDIATIA